MRRNRQLGGKVEFPNHSFGNAFRAGEDLTCSGCNGTIKAGSLYSKHYDFEFKKPNQPFCRTCFPFWSWGQDRKVEEGENEWESLASVVYEASSD